MLYLGAMQSMVSYVLPTPDDRTTYVVPSIAIPSQFEVGILVVVTIVMVLVTLYALAKIPMSVAKTGGKFVHKTTDALAPIVIKTQHKQDTQRNRMKVAPKVLIFIKLLLIAIPVVLAVLSELFGSLPIDHSIAVVVSCGMGGVSVLFFTIQYLLAATLRVPPLRLW